jgi:hypothetical protein
VPTPAPTGDDRQQEPADPQTGAGEHASSDGAAVTTMPGNPPDAAAYAEEIEQLWKQINDRLRLLPMAMREPFEKVLNDVETLLEPVPGPDEHGQWQQLDGEQFQMLRQARRDLAGLAERLRHDVKLGYFPEQHFREAANLLHEALRDHSESVLWYLGRLAPQSRTGYRQQFDRIQHQLADAPADLSEQQEYSHMLAAYEQVRQLLGALERELTL